MVSDGEGRWMVWKCYNLNIEWEVDRYEKCRSRALRCLSLTIVEGEINELRGLGVKNVP